jgi:hypothetical protein
MSCLVVDTTVNNRYFCHRSANLRASNSTPTMMRSAVLHGSMTGSSSAQSCWISSLSTAAMCFTRRMFTWPTPLGMKLVQVDPEFVFHRAERGTPKIEAFVAAGFGDPPVRPVWPVSASLTKVDLPLSTRSYITDPEVPASHGTQKVSGAQK